MVDWFLEFWLFSIFLIFYGLSPKDALQFLETVVGQCDEDELDLSEQSRDLLFAVCMGVTSSRRDSCKSLIRSLTDGSLPLGEDKREFLTDYERNVRLELTDCCSRILRLLNTRLIPHSSDNKQKLEYLVLKGDMLRYLSNIHIGSQRDFFARYSLRTYCLCFDWATSLFVGAHPMFLQVVINLSILLVDYFKRPVDAKGLLTFSIQRARNGISELDPIQRVMSLDLIQILSGNYECWFNRQRSFGEIFWSV